jgi:hypothetical protein
VVRPGRATILAVAVALAAVPAGAAHAAGWTAVSGLIPGTTSDAALDGPRVLVTSLSGRNVVVTTIEGDRVARHQTVTTAGRIGVVRRLQVVRLGGGRALAVWQEGGAIRAALRPTPGARFGPARTVSWFPGARTGAARHPAAGVTSAGEPLVAWWGGPAGGRLGIQASTMASGGAWAPPLEISAGTYPQLPPGSTPLLGIDVAGDPAGGVAVAWRQPAAAGETIVGAVRAPDGTWGAPAALGSGPVALSAPSVAAPAPGELLASWPEDRAGRACAVAATLRGAAVARDDVVCRDAAFAGYVRVTATPGGGATAAAAFRPAGPSQDGTFVEVAARGATGAWTPPALAIARAGDVAGPVTATAGRSAVGASVGDRFHRVRVALVGADGAVQRRIDGPTRPTPPPRTSVRVLPLGPGARVVLVLTPAPSLRSSRPSILTLG